MRGVTHGVLAVAAVLALGLVGPAGAAEAEKPPAVDWPFDGVFGGYDEAALQRGFQVYEEVCSSCHGVRFLIFRNLHGIFSEEPPKGVIEDEYKKLVEGYVKAIAAKYEVEDGPNDEGDMYTRTAQPADPFPKPFANDNAARAANNGALPPDLSLITKARKGGADYLYAVLTGYGEPPGDVELGEGMNYNPYFPGHQIAMPPPLFEGGVEYADGTEASVEQMAEDVTHFLVWVAEPTLEARKKLGIKVMLFLFVLTALFYASKRKVWGRVEH